MVVLPPRGPERIEFEQRALRGAELAFGEHADAGRRHFLRGLFGRHRAFLIVGGGEQNYCTPAFVIVAEAAARHDTSYLNSSDLMMIGTTLVSSMTLPMST